MWWEGKRLLFCWLGSWFSAIAALFIKAPWPQLAAFATFSYTMYLWYQALKKDGYFHRASAFSRDILSNIKLKLRRLK